MSDSDVTEVVAAPAVRMLAAGQLGSQLKQLGARLPHQLAAMSRTSKVTLGVTAGAGMLVWWMLRGRGRAKTKTTKMVTGSTRKKRVRQSSASTWLPSETGSVISRPSYNWAELQVSLNQLEAGIMSS